MSVTFGIAGSNLKTVYLQPNQHVDIYSHTTYWQISSIPTDYNRCLCVDPISTEIITNSIYAGTNIKTKRYVLLNVAGYNTHILDSGLNITNRILGVSGFVFNNGNSAGSYFAGFNNCFIDPTNGLSFYLDNSGNTGSLDIFVEYV